MKKITFILIIFLSISFIHAQTVEIKSDTIHNKMIGSDGAFVVGNDDNTNDFKLIIKRTGEVDWYLDKQLFFLRDTNFQAYDGVFTSYDFIHVDGATGRIGFNILSDVSYGELPLTSSIHLNGSISTRVRTLDGTDNYMLKQDDHTVIVSLNSNNVNIDLPPVSGAKGRGYQIKRDANSGTNANLTLTADGSDLIDGSGSYTVSKTLGVVQIVCDGTQWWIMSTEDKLVYASPVSTDLTLTNEHDVIGVPFSADNENFTVVLPDAASSSGKRYEIKRNSDGATFANNVLFIKPTGSDQLDQHTNGSPYQMLKPYESVTVQSNGTMWLILNAFNN